MSKRREDYRDCQIVVDAIAIGSRFNWAYTIDTGHFTESDESWPSELLALDLGLRAARAHVDHLLDG